MICEVTRAKHDVLYEVTIAKHAWVSLEKIWMGANEKTGGKNRCSTFVLTAFMSFGLTHIISLAASSSVAHYKLMTFFNLPHESSHRSLLCTLKTVYSPTYHPH
jgi:hypothetical protein